MQRIERNRRSSEKSLGGLLEPSETTRVRGGNHGPLESQSSRLELYPAPSASDESRSQRSLRNLGFEKRNHRNAQRRVGSYSAGRRADRY